jgi:hypothetical protein
MAIKRLANTNFAQTEIQNAVIQVLGAAPGSPVAGQVYYDSTVSGGSFMYRNSSAWINPRARGDHTGTQTASTISDFDTQVRTSRLDQMAVPTASVNMNSQKIVGLLAPTADTDAANKAYVDSVANGTDWKQSVRAATTANITLSGAQTIDGVSLVAGERVLVKDQTTASGNGLYLVASGAWTRTVDADNITEINAGMAVMVTEGTVNADSQWRLTTNDPIVLGTTNLAFAQIGAGSSYTGGNGISVSGNTISVDPAVTVRKYAETMTGSSTSMVVTHGLNTLDVIVQVVEVSTGDTVECDVKRNSTSQVTLGFAVAPTASTLRVIVHG